MTMTETSSPLVTAAKAVLLVCTRCNRTGTGINGMACAAARSCQTRCAQENHPNMPLQPITCIARMQAGPHDRPDGPQQGRLCVRDLPPEASAADAIIQVAALYAASKDDFLPRGARSPPLQAGILARRPPLSWVSGGDITRPT
jgi:predicted metal-binding protein